MIRLEKIKKTYNLGQPNTLCAIKDISLEIGNGEFVAIMGRSGAGKSTLMHIMACVEDFERGDYWLDNLKVTNLSDNKKARLRGGTVGTVFQDFSLIESFSVLENVELPLFFTKCSKKERRERALDALKRVGIKKLSDRDTLKLSGGQRQRVAIARAIVTNPRVILADEPTGALDLNTAAHIMELFQKINELGVTVIIITHEADIAALCKRKIIISDGIIVSDTKNKNSSEMLHKRTSYP